MPSHSRTLKTSTVLACDAKTFSSDFDDCDKSDDSLTVSSIIHRPSTAGLLIIVNILRYRSVSPCQPSLSLLNKHASSGGRLVENGTGRKR